MTLIPVRPAVPCILPQLYFSGIHELEKPEPGAGLLLLALCRGEAVVRSVDKDENAAFGLAQYQNDTLYIKGRYVLAFKPLDLESVRPLLDPDHFGGLKQRNRRQLAIIHRIKPQDTPYYVPVLQGGRIVTEPAKWKYLDPAMVIGVLSHEQARLACRYPELMLNDIKQCIPYPWAPRETVRFPGAESGTQVQLTNGASRRWLWFRPKTTRPRSRVSVLA